MAHLRPLRGIRYDTDKVELGGVLAPPYDVISPAQQRALYARSDQNIVRVDFGADEPRDVSGTDDRYTRARSDLESWLGAGILVREKQPALYVVDHEFVGEDGVRRVRRGILGRVPARPWAESEVLPHERTMRGPKEDRLALMRATRTQTSAVWVLWDGARGVAAALEAATGREPDASGDIDGELGAERLLLWAVTDPAQMEAIDAALAPARLYIADGHHRFETAAAYAAERRAADPSAPDEADFAMTLVYATAADDAAIEVWPTHRLVKPGAVADRISFSPDDPAGPPAGWHTLDGLARRLAPAGFRLEGQPNLAAATAAAGDLRSTAHAFGVQALDGAALLSTPRSEGASPAAALDVSVLADRVLNGALGISQDRITGGALAFTRDVDEAVRAVQHSEAVWAFTCNPTSTAEIIAVSDAGEVMPQKSSYFYPKVPTGLVLSPLG